MSTLDSVCNLAMKHTLPTMLTFGKPLYWKAAEIIIDVPQSSCLKSIVLMLGCFQTLIHLLGTIGFIIEGIGLKTYLRLFMGKMPLGRLCQGKLFRRLCGAILVLTSAYTASLYQEGPDIKILLVQAEDLYSSILMGEATQMVHVLT
ncbi:hypothetical protein DPMN_119496 [Dreissena polymorpha]|uniref:Uncharacterized protein n=1 Tax=Dreissena polymorpha TaxID=45954 RepID=A0A9D4JMU5_DREPO|nr:hypothetical protein DPMN_119496 [Dreissena polymorpha]